MKKFVFLIFLLLACCSSVLSTGISGGGLLVREYFVPNSTYEFSYALVAGTNYVNSYSVYAKNDLAKYVEFEQTRFENVPPGTSIPFKGKLVFPEKLDHPGWNVAHICVVEDCPHTGSNCGRAGACAQLTFMMLHEGKYMESTLSIQNTNENEPLKIKINIKNLGSQKLTKITSNVKILDLNNNIVGNTYLSEVLDLEPTKEGILEGDFDTEGVPPGNYTAIAVINADELTEEKNQTFRIGTLDVNVNDYTKELEINGIKRFVVSVASLWNDPIQVYASINIRTPEKTTTTQTATKTLDPWKTIELEGFIDTSDLKIGKGNTTIDLFYSENKKKIEGTVTLINPKQEESLVQTPQTNLFNVTTITIVLVVIVVILTIVNMILVLRRHKGGGDEKK